MKNAHGTLTAPPSHSTASCKNSSELYFLLSSFHSSPFVDGTRGFGCGHKSLFSTKSSLVLPILKCVAAHWGAKVYRVKPAQSAVKSTQKPVLRRHLAGSCLAGAKRGRCCPFSTGSAGTGSFDIAGSPSNLGSHTLDERGPLYTFVFPRDWRGRQLA